ncbi:MAG: helix-turn-helix domain-containing protein [Oscillospiraceae bacterium]|nr:helix-turn-helix domain-containing protein [Oscillospiraceae bacterium]
MNFYYTSEDELPLVMTFNEVREFLMISRQTLLKLLAADIIHGVKVGKQWRIYKDELLKYMQSENNT